MKKILLVEDSPEIHTMVEIALKTVAEIHWVESIKDARSATEKQNFDLYLLDMELPDGTGVELCSEINGAHPGTPIFFLTSHGELSEKVLGFAAGADDYIVKPFQPLELKARVESRLHKVEQMSQRKVNLRWKELEIDTLKQEVSVFNEGTLEPIDLTALEFKLLMFFATHVGHVVNRDKILDELWGKDVHVYPRSVDTHVSKLRKKLGPVSSVVSSVHGAGYKFVPTEA